MKKLIRNLKNPDSAQYWKATIETARIVSALPAWQRGGLVVEELGRAQHDSDDRPNAREIKLKAGS